MHITAVLMDLGIICCHSDDLAWACWERLLKEWGRLGFACTVNLINLDIMKNRARVPWKNFFSEAFLMSLNYSQEVVLLIFFYTFLLSKKSFLCISDPTFRLKIIEGNGFLII